MVDTKGSGSVAARLAALPSLPMKALWALWDQHFPRRPPHTNRHYIESRLAYRIQEKAHGALPTNVRKMLVEAGAKHSKIKTATGRSAQTLLMPGTTLIRQWDEREYRVTVTPDGLYALDGQVFKSLSAARATLPAHAGMGRSFLACATVRGMTDERAPARAAQTLRGVLPRL